MFPRDQDRTTRTSWLHVAGFVLVLWAVSSDVLAQALGNFVSDVRGTVAWSSGARAQPVRSLDPVKVGDRMRASSDSHVAVFFAADAALYLVDGPAEVAITDRGVLANGRPVAARQLNVAYRNIKASADGLVQGSLVMRGSPRVRLVAPQGAVVETDARRFQWTGDEAAWTLELASEDGNRVHRVEVRGREYSLPESVVLQPGVKYVWGIGPSANDVPALDWTEFVVDSGAPSQVDRADRVIHAVWLHERGLRRAAQRMLEDRDAP